MHGSHKLWITISVFLVVVGLLLGMYFTATPDKVGSVIKKKQAANMTEKNQTIEAVYEDMTPQETAREENSLPDALKSLDLDSIKAENSDKVLTDEE